VSYYGSLLARTETICYRDRKNLSLEYISLYGYKPEEDIGMNSAKMISPSVFHMEILERVFLSPLTYYT
jgi:hypothetical protein